VAKAPRVLETRSIDYVPRAERHGKAWHQGPFWFTGNFVLLTMTVGFVGPVIGLSVAWSALAIVLGIGFGTFFMAFHANQGPHMGLPQMIQSRAQFGSKGAILPFLATVFVYVGFIVFGVIVVTEGIQMFLPGASWFWYTTLIVSSIAIAIVGYDLLQTVQRWLTYVLILVFGMLTLSALVEGADGTATSTGGWDGTAFLIQLSLAAGYNISYSVYVSDHSRYLPESTTGPRLIAWTYAGAAGSAMWLMSLGALLAAQFPGLSAVDSLRSAGNEVFAGFGVFVVVVALLAQTTVTGVNAYGAMLTALSAVDGFRPLRATLRIRVVGLAVVGLASLVIALVLPQDYLASFNSFVLLMLYFLVPWTAINLVDFYVVRQARYSIVDILEPNGLYGAWAYRALVAYGAGMLAMVPFFALSFYTGPVADALGGADIAFVVGLVVSSAI
jgi:purine-cytosine permease-like protein